MAKTKLLHVPLELIIEPDEALRKVDRTTESYAGFLESIKLKGIMNPITVREIQDGESGDLRYGLVDGLQRFSGSKDVGLTEIPAHIISIDAGNVLEAQVIANVHKIETKPVEYSKALLKILQQNPLMSKADLANKLAKTSSWISERLGLLNLEEEIGKQVDSGNIGLSNAYVLAKLPKEEQANFLDRALTMSPAQFAPVVNARVKELRDAKRKGKDATPEEFQAVPMTRGRAELVAEMEKATIGKILCKECKPKTVEEGFALAVKWALKMDPKSQEVQRAEDEERRAMKARAKEKSKIERKKAAAKAAAEKAVKLAKEAEDEEKVEAQKEAAESTS